MFRARVTRQGREKGDEPETEVLEIEPGALSRLFVAPDWLRDAGIVAWLLVGVVLVLIGAIALMALMSTIVNPVITASIIAAVGAPVVDRLARHRVPRAAGAGLMLLAIVALGVVLAVIVLGGVTSQSDDISGRLHQATDKIATTLKDAGVGDKSADNAQSEATSSVNGAGKLLL